MNISVVIPLFNEQNSLEELTKKIAQIIDGMKLKYEILLIDDGSTDNFVEKMIYKFNDNFGNVLFSPQFLNLIALKQQPLSVKSEDELKINSELAEISFKKYINKIKIF